MPSNLQQLESKFIGDKLYFFFATKNPPYTGLQEVLRISGCSLVLVDYSGSNWKINNSEDATLLFQLSQVYKGKLEKKIGDFVGKRVIKISAFVEEKKKGFIFKKLIKKLLVKIELVEGLFDEINLKSAEKYGKYVWNELEHGIGIPVEIECKLANSPLH